MDYSINELIEWNKKIEEVVKKVGLDYYPQEFEICSFEDMIAYEAYSGMPAHYPHWSYGKAYEKTRTFYKYNLTGLPYEMVINSNPCLAYLMKDNSLLLQILTMAHVYGHNDFFKNNRLFKEGTNADYTLAMFKNHANRIREYISNPGIGYKKVERILDTAHALKLQTSRVINEKKLSRAEQIERIKEEYQQPKLKEFQLLEEDKSKQLPDLTKIPLEPEEDLLTFFIEYSDLEGWEKDVLQIVVDETNYFIPQIETKIMNEGWASFWHYQILQSLDIPQGLHLEFIKRHNQVISPAKGGINPYHVGYKIFNDIKKKYPDQPEKIFEARELERDESFIRKYLSFDLIQELNLLKYDEKGDYYVISEVADEDGWKEIRNNLASSVGMNKIPVIKVVEASKKEHTLHLKHEYLGDELEMNYAKETLKYIANIWEGPVYLDTVIKDKPKRIICNEDKEVELEDI
ncbi:stage V sporulation protein R [Orenia metallireducens]|uniref:Stage V sporulation protein R n=1 Tax=Orenia metallireducens TaxID=1413210 RepID=A0A285H5D4_9FIRM|nr:SpoVR family protein [Orenia metallireducens]PRX29462.1 stage V sporulation protein R [Orenia metallireducens]SNY30006.1 stage V sporulation protein R [Orenia metallireducens]